MGMGGEVCEYVLMCCCGVFVFCCWWGCCSFVCSFFACLLAFVCMGCAFRLVLQVSSVVVCAVGEFSVREVKAFSLCCIGWCWLRGLEFSSGLEHTCELVGVVA